jgi:hypothetical protein
MLDKIKALPEKVSFAIGLTLILGSGVLLFLLSSLFQIGNWATMIVGSIIFGVAFLFIVNASDKRHSSIDKKK